MEDLLLENRVGRTRYFPVLQARLRGWETPIWKINRKIQVNCRYSLNINVRINQHCLLLVELLNWSVTFSILN